MSLFIILSKYIVYNISYKGFDPAGNESNHIKIENILYDITQPEIVILFPLPRSISAKPSASKYTPSGTIRAITCCNFKCVS